MRASVGFTPRIKKELATNEYCIGWLTNTAGISYPPEPWHLGGEIYGSIWRVPLTSLHIAHLQEIVPIKFQGGAFVGTFLARYKPGGVLVYNELAMAVWVRRQYDLRLCSVLRIWVDSESSAVGGRELWGIPKELGTFAIQDGNPFAARVGAIEKDITVLRFEPRLRLPGMWRVSFRLAQEFGLRLKLTHARCRGQIAFGKGSWEFSAEGPLAFFTERQPLLSIRLENMTLRFGG